MFKFIPGPPLKEKGSWRAKLTVNKYDDAGRHFERVTVEGNILVYAGISCIWQFLKGNGTSTPGQALTYYDNTNAAIGVGDSNTAAAATQTDLQAPTNKLRKAMEATYPTHTDGTSSASNVITFRSSFGSSEGNFVWNEIGVFNSASAGVGRMLNRFVQNLGTKTTGTWTAEVAITMS